MDLDENYNEVIKCDSDIFESKEEIETSLNNFYHGDLSALGKIWIQALKTVLVGANFNLIPVIHAKEPPSIIIPSTPQKPPKMKFEDLPIYESPHADYKDYIESKDKNPDCKDKLLQRALLPYVQNLRELSTKAYCAYCCSVRCRCLEMWKSVNNSKDDFKKYMRDPSNLQLRQGVVAGGTLAGFLLGGGGGFPKRVIYTSLGALAAGSLCFPKETDEIFRNITFKTANLATAFYNLACSKHLSTLGEKLPCRDELPPEPAPRPRVCPKEVPETPQGVPGTPEEADKKKK